MLMHARGVFPRTREVIRLRKVISRDPQVGWVAGAKIFAQRVPVILRRRQRRRNSAIASLCASIPSAHLSSQQVPCDVEINILLVPLILMKYFI